MKVFNKIKRNNKNYLIVGYGEITKKPYLVKRVRDIYYITFDGLQIDVSKYFEVNK